MACTYKNLFREIVDFEALYNAWLRVMRGRRMQGDVLAFQQNLESNLIDIQNALLWRTYKTSPYRRFFIYEPKKREVAELPLRDRVVHHALVEQLQPIWEERFINDSYACRPGYGMHAGADRAQQMMRKVQRRSGRVYALKADIAKYFPSIPHDALKRIIRRRIACEDTLWLIDEIIDSSAEPGDPLPRGIPIGNLTSQLFANVFLHELDTFVKHDVREPFYVRYMDDFAVFSDDKAQLHRTREAVDEFLFDQLGLRLNHKTEVFPVGKQGGRALDFLGYRMWPTHRRLRKDSVKRMRHKLKRLSRQYHEGKVELEDVEAVVASWVGHAQHADTFNLRRQLFSEATFKRR